MLSECSRMDGWVVGVGGYDLWTALNRQRTFHCGEQNNIIFHHGDAHYGQLLKVTQLCLNEAYDAVTSN